MAGNPTLRILNAEPDSYSNRAVKILEEIGKVDLLQLNRTELLERISQYDVLIVRLGFQIDETVFQKATRLKAIVTATTGVDHIDLDTAEAHNVQVLCLRGEYDFLRSIPATAELTWGLLLGLIRNIPGAVNSVRNGEWDREAFRGYDLSGKKLGVLGLGRIGEKIARYGQVFDMQVAFYDTDNSKGMPGIEAKPSMQALFQWADIVSIHVPLNEFTENLISDKELSLMKGGYFINTARGAVVDEGALIRALENGNLAGAAVDVVNNERDKNNPSPLIDYAKKNSTIIITPHIGGASFDSMAATEIFMANKLKNYIKSLEA